MWTAAARRRFVIPFCKSLKVITKRRRAAALHIRSNVYQESYNETFHAQLDEAGAD